MYNIPDKLITGQKIEDETLGAELVKLNALGERQLAAHVYPVWNRVLKADGSNLGFTNFDISQLRFTSSVNNDGYVNAGRVNSSTLTILNGLQDATTIPGTRKVIAVNFWLNLQMIQT